MGADGKSAEIEVIPPLTIEPDTDNAGVGIFHSALRYSLAEFFYLEVKRMKKKNLYWLVESAIMLALAIVLELVSKSIIPKMTFGGQITIVSMLPIVLVGWKYGIGKGLVTGFVYSLAEMMIGIADGTISAAFLPPEEDGLGVGKAILMLVLDYLLAYTFIGLGAMYRKKISNNSLSLALGAFTVLFLRYLSHILSGYILYGAWAEWFFTQEGFYSWGATIMNTFRGNALSLVYSIIYNGFYMIPEIIATTVVASVIGKIPQITKTKV